MKSQWGRPVSVPESGELLERGPAVGHLLVGLEEGKIDDNAPEPVLDEPWKLLRPRERVVASDRENPAQPPEGDVVPLRVEDAERVAEAQEPLCEEPCEVGFPGQLTRACVELAKDWRTDRFLRRLEALMIVADAQASLVLTGNGDVLEPEGGIVGIGSGGNYALAAARALADTELSAEEIARKALKIAAEICVYTNNNLTVEVLDTV